MNNLSNSKIISFNDRIVDFKQIHNQKPEDFEKFLDIIDVKPDQVILDGMDGYGAVAKEILNRSKTSGFIPEIYTLDESPIQVDRARLNIPNIKPDHLIQADMRQTPFPDNKFDTVVIKMGIHEVPKTEQLVVMKEVYRILKKGGKFVIWDLSFHNLETQKVFQDLIRKKDEIAGFESLVKNRYFPRQDELVTTFKDAGFSNVEVVHEIDAHLSMRVREAELVSKDRRALLTQKEILTPEDEVFLAELGKKRCHELVSIIKKYMASVPEDIKTQLQYEETEDDIKLVPNKEIIVGYK
jgi:ubiquinone/menaquinone biosynthesis C-methylase UbiE